jgi:beta-carotene ketolase (CrtW type)
MGLIIAISIILVWGTHLIFVLTSVDINFSSPFLYFHVLLQGYLYTGLFITSHDAMHRIVSPNKLTNKVIGYISTFLFAGMSYKRLIKNHWDHHKYAGSDKDPDFYPASNNFFIWWSVFLFRYTTITQLIVMGVSFNVLNIWFSQTQLWLFWIIPAFLGTFQLFFFGTYLPHRRPHTHEMKPHQARTQKKNHLWAMLSCYFFGYHFEHHEHPHVPWWQLYKVK